MAATVKEVTQSMLMFEKEHLSYALGIERAACRGDGQGE